MLNGNFKAKQRPEVTQRQIAARTYAPFDRWGLRGEGTPTVTVESSENRPLGESAPDSDVMQVTATAVSHSGLGFGIYNWLEDGYKATRGKKVTVSYFIQADSAMDLLCGLHIPSSNTANNVTLHPNGESIAVTTEWKRHSFTVMIPNVIDATGHMVCEFHSRAGQAWDKVRLCGVQVEVNDMATDFESRTEGVELFLCQRYFEPFRHLVTVVTCSH
ncbi:hypothetical protein B6A42_13075 [Vibrio coralliilyticus]|nr:hypothetical protein B6A42_13075 [Vibrio coralliilyticus]